MTATIQTPKAGDRVIFDGSFCDDLKGRPGVIVRIRKDGRCWVKFDHLPSHRGYPIDPASLREAGR